MRVIFYENDANTRLVTMETEYAMITKDKYGNENIICFLGYSMLSEMGNEDFENPLKRELMFATCPDYKTACSVIEKAAIDGVLDLRPFDIV